MYQIYLDYFFLLLFKCKYERKLIIFSIIKNENKYDGKFLYIAFYSLIDLVSIFRSVLFLILKLLTQQNSELCSANVYISSLAAES